MSSSCSDPDCVSYSTLVPNFQEFLTQTAVQSLAYGCFVIVAFQSINQLMRQGLPSSASRRILLGAALLLLCTTTTLFALDIVWQMTNAALGPLNSSPNVMEHIYPPQMVFARINYICTDAIVVWRAWVMAVIPLSRVVLAICMLATTACTFVEGALVIKQGPLGSNVLPIQKVLGPALLMTNIVATLVTLHRAWLYRQHIRVQLQIKKKSTYPERVLFLLMESGLVYIVVVWIITYCGLVVESFPVNFNNTVAVSIPYISGFYPLVIILIVEHQKSIELSVHSADAISHSIHFAPARPQDQGTQSNLGRSGNEWDLAEQESGSLIGVDSNLRLETKLE